MSFKKRFSLDSDLERDENDDEYECKGVQSEKSFPNNTIKIPHPDVVKSVTGKIPETRMKAGSVFKKQPFPTKKKLN